jgi:hypothetical protein
MTTIKASCPSCGDVELRSPEVRLAVCTLPALSYYAFCCPSCATEVRKPANDQVVSLLVAGGITPKLWEMPAEMLEPRLAAPLTYDELLDFVLELGAVDDLAALAAAPARG